MPGKRINHSAVEDVVAIAASGATEARVEAGRCRLDFVDRDRWSQYAVEGPAQRSRLEMRLIGVERNNLAAGVDSRVGTSGTGDCDRVAQHLCQRVLKFGLHRDDVWVTSKTVKRGSVVGNVHPHPNRTFRWGHRGGTNRFRHRPPTRSQKASTVSLVAMRGWAPEQFCPEAQRAAAQKASGVCGRVSDC